MEALPVSGAADPLALLRDRRVVLTLALCTGIAVVFWSGSRYPDLNEKALLGGAAILEDPLGFEAVLPVVASDAFPRRVFRSTVNWVMTNRKGMTFGLLFAAGFLALFRLIG